MEKQEYAHYTLNEPPQWLKNHQDYSPWANGKIQMFDTIIYYYLKYIVCISDQIDKKITINDFLTDRLFTCLIYHWELGGKNRKVNEIGEALEQKKGFLRTGNLGGNPMFDLVLASECVARKNQAAIYFEATYGEYLKAVAAKRDRKWRYSQEEIPDWWNPFYIHLAGLRDSGKAALDAYRGYSGLKAWLRVTLAFFLKSLTREESTPETSFSDINARSTMKVGDIEENIMDYRESEPVLPEAKNEFDEHFIEALKMARSELTAIEWNRIYYFYSKKLTNREIARLYGESEPNASRRRESALEHFRKVLFCKIESDPIFNNISRESLGTYIVNPDSALVRFLRESQEESDINTDSENKGSCN